MVQRSGGGGVTCTGGSSPTGRGVGDAPQGKPARRVPLDQELVERLPAAKEEARDRWTDEELQGENKE